MFLDSSLLINKQKLEGIEKEITCPICQGIINDPYFCNKCQNNFCSNCILKYKINNSKCPFRCNDPEYISNRFLKNIFSELLKFKCEKGCTEIIPYNEVNSHSDKCDKENFKEKYLECATKLEIIKVQLENYKDLENELDGVRGRNEELQNELDNTREENFELREKNDNLKNENEELNENNNDLEAEVEELKEKINDLENEIKKLREKNDDLENEMGKYKSENKSKKFNFLFSN